MKQRMKVIAAWLFGIVVLTGLDQYTKHLAVRTLKGKQPLILIDGVFELLYSENRGAAFGMLQGQQTFFFVIAAFVFLLSGYAMWKIAAANNRRYLGLELCITLLSAGAVGNMADRIRQGYVVDFLYFKLINFPIFNVADIYVTVSAGLLILLVCFVYKEDELEIFNWKPKEKKS